MFKLCALVACAMLLQCVVAHPTFDEYVEQYNKNYDSIEFEQRRAMYEAKLVEIDAINAKELTHTAGVNQFSDFTQEEWDIWVGKETSVAQKLSAQKMVTHSKKSLRFEGAKYRESVNVADLPDSVDWRNVENVVTAVKNQGQCGSCWAFASTEALESAAVIQNNQSGLVLAPQQFVDCAPNPQDCGGTGGCEGSIAELAYDYLKTTAPHGLVLESEYPYTATDGNCATDGLTAAVTLEAYEVAKENNYTDVMNYVANVGPVSITVDASSWSSYSSGIYDGCNNDSPDLDHLVQLVGYGTDSGNDYWIVRNSWGETYGEDGYIRLKRYNPDKEGTPCGIDTTPEDGSGCTNPPGPDSVKVCGNCGLLYDVVWPIVKQ